MPHLTFSNRYWSVQTCSMKTASSKTPQIRNKSRTSIVKFSKSLSSNSKLSSQARWQCTRWFPAGCLTQYPFTFSQSGELLANFASKIKKSKQANKQRRSNHLMQRKTQGKCFNYCDYIKPSVKTFWHFIDFQACSKIRQPSSPAQCTSLFKPCVTRLIMRLTPIRSCNLRRKTVATF